MKFTFDSPEVQSLLVGVFRCSPQTYYRVDPETGRSIIHPIRKYLIGLGMCSKTASHYLKRANLPITPFFRDETEKPPAKRRGPPPVSEEEREAKRAKEEAAQNSKRYQLIVSTCRKSGAEPKHGVWDEVAGRVIEIFTSRRDAIEALIQLKTGNPLSVI